MRWFWWIIIRVLGAVHFCKLQPHFRCEHDVLWQYILDHHSTISWQWAMTESLDFVRKDDAKVSGVMSNIGEPLCPNGLLYQIDHERM